MANAAQNFVHLHVHSSYSLLEGAVGIPELSKLAAKDGMAALALTDTNNLFGALEFSEKLSGAGIQPIVGIDLAVVFDDVQSPRGSGQPSQITDGSLVLLAMDEQGYENLMALSSAAFLTPAIDAGVGVNFERLEALSDGLIVLSGGIGGPVDRLLASGKASEALARFERLRRVFGDRFYVEVQRFDAQFDHEEELVSWADRYGVGLVATNNVLFGQQSGHAAHDALMCIAEGRVIAEQHRRRIPQEQYFRSQAEMVARFADLPDAIANTVEIARRCSYRPLTRKPILPQFASGGDEGDELARQAIEGLASRLVAHPPASGMTVEDYQSRLAFELDVIRKMRYSGYFLIVSDFIKYAKSKSIPVGPGRGSGAGSLVAYALTITDIDPLRFGLLFERFLNPDRVSMPDFDIDFCQDRRGEVIDYVVEKYGSERVAQIITFGSLQARGVIRDVGRVLELPYGQVDKLTKLVPQNPANPVKLADAIAGEPKLQEEAKRDPTVDRLLTIAQSLEGLYRHASTHAAGIVIGDRALQKLVPLYRDPRSDMLVTQFNMKWVEPAGLVKFDFLGLKTLTVLQKAVELLAKRGIELDLSLLPLDDRKSYEMLSKGETVGVFQVESAGMRRALAEMKPDRLEDIIALVALYRPGPMANIPVYCKRKHGEEVTEYAHPALKPVLEETFGVIVYQEQVMEIAKILSGYSLGEADLLRRAMGKKIKAEMDKQRSRFVTGAVERGIGSSDAEEIFDLLARFADYGFNKSHAAAYALVSYQTAYLKANFPVEFLAASMSLEMSNVEKLVEFKREAERIGISVEPPSINASGVDFDVRDGKIIYALSAIRGLGADMARSIVEARQEAGDFGSIEDFARRLPPKVLNKRVIETLSSAGAFDGLKLERAQVHAGADRIAGLAQQTDRDRCLGQSQLFGEEASGIALPDVAPWPLETRLQNEFDAVGFFLSGHPLDSYRGPLRRMGVADYASFARAVRSGATAGRLAATVINRQERRTKTGNKMGIALLSDSSGQFEVLLFNEMLQQFRELFEPGQLVLIQVGASSENDDIRLRLQSAETLATAVERSQPQLRIFIRDDRAVQSLSALLKRKGQGEISIVVIGDRTADEVELKLPGRHDVSAPVMASLKTVPGVLSVEAA